ncbi:AMP-binding protein [Streptomyces sp. NBC_01353]|uniref:AMP-binding protein n=1 Tax=Streptomyces sp. NBC_01353 TaxID=2903835 RepID=UPI003DA49012
MACWIRCSRALLSRASSAGVLRYAIEAVNHRSDLHARRRPWREPSGVRDAPQRHAGQRRPQGRRQEALVCGEQRWSCAELAADVRRAAAVLRDAGLRPGGRLAVMTYNTPAFVIAAFGTCAAGVDDHCRRP